MPSKLVLDAVRARQAGGWTEAPVYYPNDAVAPPNGIAAFVIVEFPVSAGVAMTLDPAGMHEEAGSIRFVIHVRLKTGIDAAFEYADELADLFRSARLVFTATQNLQTGAPGPAAGLGADGAYSLVSIAVPYRLFFVP